MSDRLDNLRVLIVGSDGHGEAAARMLAERGADVATAKSTTVGLELVRGGRFDVLLSEMPTPPVDGDGTSFIDQLRRLPADAGGRTPAIALHGATPRDTQRRSAVNGDGRFQDELSIPLDPDQLTSAIRALAPVLQRDSTTNNVASETASKTALRVLVVDDTRVVADVLGQIIGAIGHDATVVHSGREAVETITRNEGAFDVIFSDISMPDMNGHELAERLRSLRQSGKLGAKLIIAMSGYSDPEEMRRSRESGFDRHIVKPPEFHDLEALLDEVAKM